MVSSDWPTWWILVAPLMMLAFMAVCMGSMRCMMRDPHGRRDADYAEGSRGSDLARPGPHVPARFPDGQAAFEDYGAAADKAEFDRFIAEHRKRQTPPA